MGRNLFATKLIIIFFLQSEAFSSETADLTGEITYTGELWQVASGGIDTGARYLQNIDLTYGGNLDKYGLEGGSFFLYGLINNKSELSSDIIGDLQVVSNIDNGEVFRLYEAWYQHEFSNLRAKIGLIDLNSEFNAIDTAGLFINSSHGIGPDFSQTGKNGPSIFPSTSLAMVVELTNIQNFRITAGIFGAVPNDPENPKNHKLSLNEGALLVGEVNYLTDGGLRFGLGIYSYTSKFTTIPDPSLSEGGNTGIYGIIEAPLTKNTKGWLRYGRANSRLNSLRDYIGGGLMLSQPFPERSDDKLGIAFGWARAGDDFKQDILCPAQGELNIELTYHYRITERISIQPDIQYIINPGSSHALRDALVLGIRFQVGQGF